MEIPKEGPVPEEFIEDYLNYRDTMIEKIAETDDELLFKYLEEEEITNQEIKDALRRATIGYSIIPVLCGTALRTKGIQPLIEAICEYLPSPLVPPVTGTTPTSDSDDELIRSPDPEEPFSALAFKTVSDPYIGRLVYFRVYSGTAASGSSVYNSTNRRRERLGRIVQMHAQHREDMEEVHAGQIAAAVG